MQNLLVLCTAFQNIVSSSHTLFHNIHFQRADPREHLGSIWHFRQRSATLFQESVTDLQLHILFHRGNSRSFLTRMTTTAQKTRLRTTATAVWMVQLTQAMLETLPSTLPPPQVTLSACTWSTNCQVPSNVSTRDKFKLLFWSCDVSVLRLCRCKGVPTRLRWPVSGSWRLNGPPPVKEPGLRKTVQL